MMYEKYESPLSSRYASEEMLHLFSQEKRIQTWRRLMWSISKRPSAATSDTYPSERSEMRTSSGEWAHGTGSTKKKYDSVCR